MRSVLVLAFVLLLSGCLEAVDDPAGSDPEASGPAGSTANGGQVGGGPGQPDLKPAQAGPALGMLYLHNDGQRQWMSTQAAGAGEDLPLPGLLASSQGATYTFPLEPAPTQDFVTGGYAFFELATSSSASVSGSTPTFVASLSLDGTPVGSASARGSHSAAIAVPATIPSGSALVLEICFCGGLADLSLVVFEPADSRLEVPAVTASRCNAVDVVLGTASVELEGTNWVARRTDKASGNAPSAYDLVSLQTSNGDVGVQKQGSGSYSFAADLHARGSTSQEAQDRLAALCIEFSAEGQDLTANLVALDGSQSGGNRGANLRLTIPTAQVADLRLDASNGGLTATGLDVGQLAADTSNGGITVDASVQSLRADTSNGAITLKGNLHDVEAGTSNGKITLEAGPLGSGDMDWTLETSNGAVTADVATGSGIGYDASGSTSNGEVTFDLPGTEDVGSQSKTDKHVRTTGFESREQRVTLDIETSNGPIRVD